MTDAPRRALAAHAILLLVATAACRRNADSAPGTTPSMAQAPPPRSAPADAGPLRLPNRAGSIKFAVIGDAGRGSREQYDVAEQMIAYRRAFAYDFVLMVGDNVYDGGTPDDYRLKFELPYKPLRDAGVNFYAAIGNHDDPNQPSYAPFHMDGQRYYTFKKDTLLAPAVRFFMVDTEQLDRTQLAWLAREAGGATEKWKIAVFHRPIYTSGRYARPARLLRGVLEPILVNTGITTAFSGHEHFYERLLPQNGITYFISGGAGSLRLGDIRQTGLTAAGFDRDYHFLLVEIAGDTLFFQAISRTGVTVDNGTVRRRDAPVPTEPH